MRSFLVPVPVVVVVAVGVAANERKVGNPIPLPEGPQEGARLFEKHGCASCHTVGAGEDRAGPNLGRLKMRMSFMDGAARIWNHLPEMQKRMRELHVSYPQITGDELVNLIAFLTSYQYYLTRVGRPATPSRGEVLFTSKACPACHSLEPGVKSRGPNLSAYGGGRSTLEVAQAMWNHGPKMQRELETRGIARPAFRPGEMTDLLGYLATRGAPAGATTAFVEPGSPARGQAVFKTHGCNRCHAVRGVGGKSGPDAPPDLGRRPDSMVQDYTDVAAVLWNHAVPMWDRMQREGVSVEPLRDREMADLVAYLYFVNYDGDPGDPDIGAKVFEAKKCGRCHALKETGTGKIGPALGVAPGLMRTQDILAAMWRAAPKMREAMQKQLFEWPRFEPGQMSHLVAFLRASHVAAGRKGGSP